MFNFRRSEERIATEESGAERPITQMSMIGLKSQTSNSTANRPLWGAHKSKAKYQVDRQPFLVDGEQKG